MGHLVGKDVYRRLGSKIDGLTMRTPWNATFYEILKELYSEEEAEVIIKMPYSTASFSKVKKTTGFKEEKLRRILQQLCSKGLVIDLVIRGKTYYTPSPMVPGIYEFTMMRAGPNVDFPKLSKLFKDYFEMENGFLAANGHRDILFSPLRTIPHEETIKNQEYIEVLDYEKASALIDDSDTFGSSVCACRHENEHAGDRRCDTPLDTCTSLGNGAEYLIRNGLAREISKSEMKDILQRSRDTGLVLNADNVQKNITFLCHCCACCCHPLVAIRELGYPHYVMTSNLLARIDLDTCEGCGKCAKACPIDAIAMKPDNGLNKNQKKRKKAPKIDASICLGCGVCAIKCKPQSLKLSKRKQQVIHPETTFQRILLQSLEKDNLENLLFDDPEALSHKAMRAFLGAFLRLPQVKMSLLNGKFRSRFLDVMQDAVKKKGQGFLAEI